MRSYTATLLFEQALDFVDSGSDIYEPLNRIFSPFVPVVMNDCETLLGEKVDLTLDLKGRYELDTDVVINRIRLNTASINGEKYIRVRALHTCIAPGGMCRLCYRRTYLHDPVPDVGDLVQVHPQFVLQTEHISLDTGETEGLLSYSPDEYDDVFIYVNSNLKVETTDYTITGKTIELTAGMPSEGGGGGGYGTITARYIVGTRSPFVYWLASKYSGSLIGLAALPARPLPLRESLYSSLLPAGEVEYLSRRLLSSPLTPTPIKDYLPKIADPLEKAVFVSLLSAIFLS